MPLIVNSQIVIPDHEITISAVRSQGAGGQNVNKVATAAHLRFDIRASSLPELCKERLLGLRDQRITQEGVIVIKAQARRSLEANRDEALERLRGMIVQALAIPRKRRPTRPGREAVRRRVEGKVRRGRDKALRSKRVESE